MYFRAILGDALLDKVKDLVREGTIGDAENAAYKRLVDKSQYYLLYRSIVSLLPVITFKMANAGVVKTPDEKVEVASQEQVSLEQSRYQAQADAECRKLQNYLLANAGRGRAGAGGKPIPDTNGGPYPPAGNPGGGACCGT